MAEDYTPDPETRADSSRAQNHPALKVGAALTSSGFRIGLLNCALPLPKHVFCPSRTAPSHEDCSHYPRAYC